MCSYLTAKGRVQIRIKSLLNFFQIILFWFGFLLQEALEHNSFLSPEKKIEQGNVDYAFKHVDQIVEGMYSCKQPEKGSNFSMRILEVNRGKGAFLVGKERLLIDFFLVSV